MPQDYLIFDVTVKFGFFLCLSFEVSNVDVCNGSEQAPAEKLVMLTSVLVLDTLARVQIIKNWKNPLTQCRMRTLLETGFTVLLRLVFPALEGLCCRPQRLVQFACPLMHIRAL